MHIRGYYVLPQSSYFSVVSAKVSNYEDWLIEHVSVVPTHDRQTRCIHRLVVRTPHRRKLTKRAYFLGTEAQKMSKKWRHDTKLKRTKWCYTIRVLQYLKALGWWTTRTWSRPCDACHHLDLDNMSTTPACNKCRRASAWIDIPITQLKALYTKLAPIHSIGVCNCKSVWATQLLQIKMFLKIKHCQFWQKKLSSLSKDLIWRTTHADMKNHKDTIRDHNK